MKNLRDQALEDLEMLLRGAWKSPATHDMQNRLGLLTADQRELFREVADRIITTGMHDFLFALQEASDANQGIEVRVDGTNVASLSDGLHGEIFSEEGWIAKHSKFPREHD